MWDFVCLVFVSWRVICRYEIFKLKTIPKRIPKMCLKSTFSFSKWVVQAILSLIVLSNCVSVSSNFDTAFLPDCTKFCSGFACYWIENLMRILKMCLKSSFSYSKWVVQAILSLIVLSNCVSVSSNFDTAFLPDCTKFCSVFPSH